AREIAQPAGDYAQFGQSQSPEALIGFLAQSQLTARITNVAKLGQASAPAAQSAFQSGTSVEQAQELFVTMNRLVNDAEGKISSTATIALVEQLNEFEPLKDIKNPVDKIKALQSNPKLAGEFLEVASFEKKALSGVKSLVQGDERGLREQAYVTSQIGSLSPDQDAVNIAAFNKYTNFLSGEGSFSGALFNAERASQRNIEEQGLANKERALTAQINKIFKDSLSGVNLPGSD